MFQHNDLVCIFKGIISSFLHCSPSFAFKPRTRKVRAQNLGNALPCPEACADLEIWGAAGKKQQRRGVGRGKQGCPPPDGWKGDREGGAEQSLQVFLTWSHLPPLDTPKNLELPDEEGSAQGCRECALGAAVMAPPVSPPLSHLDHLLLKAGIASWQML